MEKENQENTFADEDISYNEALRGNGVMVEIDENGNRKKVMHYDDIVEVLEKESKVLSLQARLQKQTNDRDNLITKNKKSQREIKQKTGENAADIFKLHDEIEYRKRKISTLNRSIKKMEEKITENISSKTDKELIDMEFALMAACMDIKCEQDELGLTRKVSAKKYAETQVKCEFVKMNLMDLRRRVINTNPDLFPELTNYYAVRMDMTPSYDTIEEYIAAYHETYV